MVEPIEKAKMESFLSRKVILWGRESLLTRAIETLLQEEIEWVVVRVPSDHEFDGLFEESRRVRPDVVILCTDFTPKDDSLVPLRLINEQLSNKVISIDFESNFTRVYSKQDIVLQGTSDLLSIIESRNSSVCTSGMEGGTGQ